MQMEKPFGSCCVAHSILFMSLLLAELMVGKSGPLGLDSALDPCRAELPWRNARNAHCGPSTDGPTKRTSRKKMLLRREKRYWNLKLLQISKCE